MVAFSESLIFVSVARPSNNDFGRAGAARLRAFDEDSHYVSTGCYISSSGKIASETTCVLKFYSLGHQGALVGLLIRVLHLGTHHFVASELASGEQILMRAVARQSELDGQLSA